MDLERNKDHQKISKCLGIIFGTSEQNSKNFGDKIEERKRATIQDRITIKCVDE